MFSFFQGRYVLRGFNEHEKTERVFSQLDQILGEQRLLEQLIREVRFFFIISIAWRYWRYWRLSLHLFLIMLKLNGTQLINLLQCLSCSDNGDVLYLCKWVILNRVRDLIFSINCFFFFTNIRWTFLPHFWNKLHKYFCMVISDVPFLLYVKWTPKKTKSQTHTI